MDTPELSQEKKKNTKKTTNKQTKKTVWEEPRLLLEGFLRHFFNLGSHWEYPRSSCMSCTSWQETDLELSRNRKVSSFHNSSFSLQVALCLSIGCHTGTRWAPLRPALPTPNSTRNNQKKCTKNKKPTEIQMKASDEFYTSRSLPDLNFVYSSDNLKSHPVNFPLLQHFTVPFLQQLSKVSSFNLFRYIHPQTYSKLSNTIV